MRGVQAESARVCWRWWWRWLGPGLPGEGLRHCSRMTGVAGRRSGPDQLKRTRHWSDQDVSVAKGLRFFAVGRGVRGDRPSEIQGRAVDGGGSVGWCEVMFGWRLVTTFFCTNRASRTWTCATAAARYVTSVVASTRTWSSAVRASSVSTASTTYLRFEVLTWPADRRMGGVWWTIRL